MPLAADTAPIRANLAGSDRLFRLRTIAELTLVAALDFRWSSADILPRLAHLAQSWLGYDVIGLKFAAGKRRHVRSSLLAQRLAYDRQRRINALAIGQPAGLPQCIPDSM